jgi:hypothetical protein
MDVDPGDSQEVDTSPELHVNVCKVPYRYFGWQRRVAELGGFRVTVEGADAVGEETTLAGALEDLADRLEDWALPEYDEDAEIWVDPEPDSLRELVDGLVTRAWLLDALRASAAGVMPVVDEGEDLLPARQEPSDGHRMPEMFGYLGDGERQSRSALQLRRRGGHLLGCVMSGKTPPAGGLQDGFGRGSAPSRPGGAANATTPRASSSGSSGRSASKNDGRRAEEADQ